MIKYQSKKFKLREVKLKESNLNETNITNENNTLDSNKETNTDVTDIIDENNTDTNIDSKEIPEKKVEYTDKDYVDFYGKDNDGFNFNFKINKSISLDWKKKLVGILYYMFVFVYLEISLHLIIYRNVTPRIIYPILFALVSGSILYAICSLLPEKINRIIGILAISVLVIYYEVQLVYHFIFGSFMPISQVAMGAAAVTNFFNQVIHAITRNLLSIIILILPIPITIFLYCKKIIKAKRITLIQIPMFIMISLAFSGVVMTTLHTFNTTSSSAYATLVNTNSSTEACIKNLGLAVTTLQETRGLLIAKNTPIVFTTTTLSYLSNETKDKNELTFNFAELNSKTDNPKIHSINNYLSVTSPTAKNQYTGQARGYNLITICAESFSPVAISKELTPTLYKLSNAEYGGFVFKNFYNCFPNTTTNGEYAFVMGLMPNMSRTKVASSFDDTIGNYLPYCLGNIYSEMGMPAYAYHNYYGTFYDRKVTHKNMGYNFKAIDAGLEMKVDWPSSDLDMIKVSVDDYINSDKPFHAYYMTFSGHYQYDWKNAMSKKNKQKVDNLPYSEAAKAYLACNLELEYALEELIDQLKKAGKFDNTVIVLTGDHYPYGLTENEYNELAGRKVDTFFERFKGTFICHVPGMDRTIVNEYCSTPDILPTILNLMGLEYDSRLLAGKDVFSDAPHIAVLADQSYITDTFKYNASTGEAIGHDGSTIDPYIIDNYSNYVANMFTLSNGILETDYYSFIFEKKSEHNPDNYIRYEDISSPFTESAVTFMVQNGYMTADDPENNVFGAKRKENVSDFIKIIYNMAGAPAVDTSDGRPPELVWATMHGILEDTTLWNHTITKGEASYIIYKYLDIVIGIPKDTEYARIDELCAKYPSIPRERIIAAKWCKENTVVEEKKDDGALENYYKDANRGNMATYLQRMYSLSINKG